MFDVRVFYCFRMGLRMAYLGGFLVVSFGVLLALPAMEDAEEPEISDKTDQSGNYLILGLGVG